MKYMLTIALASLLSSCTATMGNKKTYCERLTKNIEICRDKWYTNLGYVEFCRFKIDRGPRGHNTKTEKFRCEGLLNDKR